MVRLIAAVLAILTLSATVAVARPQALTVAEWRADLVELDIAIRQYHPKPFARIEEKTYAEAVARLKRDIPSLTDQEIILRLAEIVALIKDGHTRLALPRQHPKIGLEFGHAKTDPPKNAALRLAQTPIAFEKFADGLFIVGADAAHRELIGKKVISVGGVEADEALAAIRKYAFAENEQLASLMGADLLSLPVALRGAGLSISENRIALTIQSDGVEARLNLAPLSVTDVDWVNASIANMQRYSRPGEKLWFKYIPELDAVYAKIDEIADAGPSFAEFSAKIIREAEVRDTRLIIDLRDNFGGDADLNRSIALALIGSEKLNRYGRLYVLTGPRTFSAAQLLVNQLERYTRALFVGEGTGARPDHFGDSKRFRLKNSEITLRVSTVHWSSLVGLDKRETTGPDFPAPMTSADYFSGTDPALVRIAAIPAPPTLRELLSAALERNDHYQVYRYLADVRLNSETYARDLSGDLLAVGDAFTVQGKTDLASFAYRYGLYYYPDNTALKNAFAKLPSQ